MHFRLQQGMDAKNILSRTKIINRDAPRVSNQAMAQLRNARPSPGQGASEAVR